MWTLLCAGATATEVEGCDVAIVGGGIGGLYTAWRLAVDTDTVEPSSVCLFEGAARFGGRIFSFAGIPGYEDFTVDLGAYRFHRAQHVIVRSLVEDVLDIDTACYTDPLHRLPRNTTECPPDPRVFTTTRGVSFLGGLPEGGDAADDLAAWTPDIPFAIDESERWTAETGPPSFIGVFFGNSSLIQPIARHWDTLISAPDHATMMRVADDIIAGLRTETYNGVPYAEISILHILESMGVSPELMAFQEGTASFGYSLVNAGVAEFFAQAVRSIGSSQVPISEGRPARDLVSPVAGEGTSRRRIGMKKVLDSLLDKIESAGVRVYTEKKLAFVERRGRDGGVRLHFCDGASAEAGRVFLNIGKADLAALGADSEPLASSPTEFTREFEAVRAVGYSKIYCFWPQAWWLSVMKKEQGVTRTQYPAAKHTRYHDGSVACSDPDDLSTCKGALLVSYSDADVGGLASGSYVATRAEEPYTPWMSADANTTLVKGVMTPRQQLFFDEIVYQLRESHRPALEALGMPDVEAAIPEPDACVAASWFDISIHERMPYVRLTDKSLGELAAKPVDDLNVHLVNEAWGSQKGWAEGSLQAAERALFHHVGLAPPQWLDAVYYESVIVKFDRGSAGGASRGVEGSSGV